MASQPSDQKRKRGRPANASKPIEHAPSRESLNNNNDNDAEEEARPRKRGRKAFTNNIAADPVDEEHAEPAKPKRRGRPVKSKTQIPEAEVDSPGPGDTSKSKSNSVDGKAKATEAQAGAERTGSEPRRSGREKRSYNPGEMSSARHSNHSPTQFTSPPSASSRPLPSRTKKPGSDPPSSTPRRSGRERRAWDSERLFSASRQNVGQQEESSTVPRMVTEKARSNTSANAAGDAAGLKAQNLKETAQNTAIERKKRMPRNQKPGEVSSNSRNVKKTQATNEAEISTADAAQPRRPGRPKRSSPPSQEAEPNRPSRSRGRPSQARDEPEEEPAPVKSRRNPPQPRREPEVDVEDSSESGEEEDTLPYRYLKETSRNIQRSTISDKWSPLDPPSIDAISSFLADAQRPVLLRLQNTSQRRGHASTALGVVIRRLRSRLVKGVPFPTPTARATRSNAASYEDDFDFERTVDAMQTLEDTLNPLLHSVGLLEREISKEEHALARDYDSLYHLETNAKAAAKEWRDKTRREHVLAPGVKRKIEQEIESRDHLELVPAAEDDLLAGTFKDLEDEELVTLSRQIGSHMESMKGNLQPIDGVLPAIVKSKAALQQVLLKHLDDEQYENVLLG